MVIGVLQFELLIHGAESLKDKRRVVNSVKDRFHREHLVSIAEIGRLENPSVAMMGLALVGRDGKHVGEVLDRVTARLRQVPGAELGDTSRQILHGAGRDAWDGAEPADGGADESKAGAAPPRSGLGGHEHDFDQEMLRRAQELDEQDGRDP